MTQMRSYVVSRHKSELGVFASSFSAESLLFVVLFNVISVF